MLSQTSSSRLCRLLRRLCRKAHARLRRRSTISTILKHRMQRCPQHNNITDVWYGELAPLLSHVPLLLSRSASARSQFLDPVTVTALFSGQAVGFPPSARWRESLQLAVVVKIADGAEAYSALTQFFLYQKKETDTYLPTGSALAASRLWSHAGVSRQAEGLQRLRQS